MLPIRVFADAFIVSSQATEGLKAPGYSYSRLPDVLRSQFIAQSVWKEVWYTDVTRYKCHK